MDFFSKLKWQKWAIALLLLLNIATLTIMLLPVLRHHAPRHNAPRDFLIHTLDMTDDQVAAYQKLIDTHRKNMHQHEEESKELIETYFKNLGAESNEKAAKELDTWKENEALMHEETYKHLLQVRDLLTEAQQAKFDHELERMLQMMAGKRPHGPRPHGGH
ncbi:periplasmic heavy metal sensor [bacterium]|nr:periplasmic heavy metal sensor [bacterium]